MRTMKLKTIASGMFLLTLLALVACGGGSKGTLSTQSSTGNSQSTPTLVAMSVSPSSTSVAFGSTKQFTATGSYSDGTTKDLTSSATWSSSSTAVATVSASGLANAVAAGASNIQASFSGVKGSAALTVTAPAPTVTSIVVSPSSISLAAGGSQKFSATAIYSDSTTQDVTSSATWTSSAASVATVDTNGNASAIAVGNTTILASLNGMSGAVALTVSATTKVNLVSLAISPSTSSVTVGTSVQLHATGSYSDGSTKDLTSQVTWSSGNASVSTVSASGLVSTLAPGVAVVSATSGSISGAANLNVAASAPTVSSVTVVANSTMGIGGSQQLGAQATLSDGSTQDVSSRVTWSSSKTNIATVDGTGKMVAVASGTVTVTATLPEGVSGSATVTVNTASLAALSVSPDGLNLPIGVTQQFTASGDFSDGTTQDLTSTVAWSTSDPTLATVDANGVVTTIAAGTVVITASKGGQSDTSTLTIVPAKLVSISVQGKGQMSAFTSQQFTALGVFDDGSTQPLPNATWTSSASGIATVDANGVVTAFSAGNATITATFDSVSGSTSVTVTNATISSLTISPLNGSASVDTSTQFTATGQFSDGSTQDLTAYVIWTSSVGSVATISNSGVASALSNGVTTITASYGSATASTQLTVSPAKLVSLAIVPANPVMAPHTRMQLKVVGTYSDGSTSSNINVSSWKSSKNRFATMRSGGVVFAKRAGSSTITVTAAGLSASTTLTISSATLKSIAITPANATISVGSTQQYTATGTLSDNNQVDLTYVGHWASSNASVALISNTPGQPGLATAVVSGSTNISVTVNGVSSLTGLTVQ